jgi:hypothetical protein
LGRGRWERGDEASQKFGGNWHREGILSRSKNKRYFLFMIQKLVLRTFGSLLEKLHIDVKVKT